MRGTREEKINCGSFRTNMGFPGGSDSKESAYNAGDTKDMGLIPGSGRSPGEENNYSLQYSCLEIPWMEEPGRLQSMGSKRVGHDRVINTFIFSDLYSKQGKSKVLVAQLCLTL